MSGAPAIARKSDAVRRSFSGGGGNYVNRQIPNLPEIPSMHYVYVIESEEHPDQVYTGYTTDLKQRFKAHNAFGCTHTSKYKPWRLQAYLQSGSGRAFSKRHLR